jgi:hypothetical protein
MHTRPEVTSPADVAGEAGSIMAGLGIVTVQLFPFALPLLILALGPLLPLALVPLVLAVLAVPILLPLWLGRLVLRAIRGRRERRPAGHQPRGKLAH